MKDTFVIVRQSAAYNADYFTITDNNDRKETNKENPNYKKRKRKPPSRAIQAIGDAIQSSVVKR